MPVASQLALLVKRSFGERITFVGTAIVYRENLILKLYQQDLEMIPLYYQAPVIQIIKSRDAFPTHLEPAHTTICVRGFEKLEDRWTN